ncbi:MAG: ATP-binding protein [Anaerostipes sp.]|jgi:hypothetical protein
MTIFYQIMDVAMTLSEAIAFMLIVSAFCPNYRNKYVRWILVLLHFCDAYAFTWLTDYSVFKLPILSVLAFIWVKLCYKDNLYRAAISIFVTYFIIGASESLAVLTGSVLPMKLTVEINGTQFLTWQVYALHCLFILFLAGLCNRVFKNFQYEINIRDFIIISVSYAVYLFFWIGAITPLMSNYSEWFNPITEFSVLALFFFVCIQFLYTKNNYALKEQAKNDQIMIERLKQQYAYYEDKLKTEERVRGVYHDLKNHLLLLQGQSSNAETDKMITSLQEQIAGYENYYHTGNKFLDVIIRDKAQAAKEQNIDFSVLIHFEDSNFIAPLDVSTIFGNALDNAIEASVKLPLEQRLITVKANRLRDMLMIAVENNMKQEIRSDSKSNKDDQFLHGFGLSNIRNAVEKYGGECIIKSDGGKFVLKIILPIQT